MNVHLRVSHYLHAKPQRDFHPGLISTAHRVSTSANSPWEMWNALLRSVTDCGRNAMYVTSFIKSHDFGCSHHSVLSIQRSHGINFG
ncbi:MAG: hypothetical protein RMY29_014515 [Nostoc sp. CreGUA01]